jgi:hypothetical protein
MINLIHTLITIMISTSNVNQDPTNIVRAIGTMHNIVYGFILVTTPHTSSVPNRVPTISHAYETGCPIYEYKGL